MLYLEKIFIYLYKDRYFLHTVHHIDLTISEDIFLIQKPYRNDMNNVLLPAEFLLVNFIYYLLCECKNIERSKSTCLYR